MCGDEREDRTGWNREAPAKRRRIIFTAEQVRWFGFRLVKNAATRARDRPRGETSRRASRPLLLFGAREIGSLDAFGSRSGSHTYIRQARPQPFTLRRAFHERHEELHGLEHSERFTRGAQGFLRREESTWFTRGREHRGVLKQGDELIFPVRLREKTFQLVRVRHGDVHRACARRVRVSSRVLPRGARCGDAKKHDINNRTLRDRETGEAVTRET